MKKIGLGPSPHGWSNRPTLFSDQVGHVVTTMRTIMFINMTIARMTTMAMLLTNTKTMVTAIAKIITVTGQGC